jgi:hypothetical protein
MHRVEPALHGPARRLEGGLVGVARTSTGSPSTMAPRPKGRPRLARSQLRTSMRRLVATATGTIGRPECCASTTIPRPQRRATFGTSAVITTVSPLRSARSIARSACAPPFRRTSRPRAPEPRMAPMPRRRSTTALISPSAERETRLTARSPGLRANGTMKCWPCHMAAITGSGPMRA